MSSHFDESPVGDEVPSPLHDAARRGDVVEVRRLITAGIDVNALNWEGICPLLCAVEGGSMEVATVLLRAGSMPDGVNHTLSPFVAAAWEDRRDLVELLLQFGADVNRPDPETGDTALMAAAGVGNLPFVDFLLSLGAKPDVKTRKGEDALYYANVGGHIPVIRRLSNLFADRSGEKNESFEGDSGE